MRGKHSSTAAMLGTMVRGLFLSLLVSLTLAACDQVVRGDKLTPQAEGNAVAVSNLNLGIAYMQQGEFEKALDKLNRALEADPKYTPTLNALGILYQRLGKDAAAEGYFKQALSINGNDPHTLTNYGQFLCSHNQYDRAQEFFHKAASNPLYESPEKALTNAGTCALSTGQVAAAEAFFMQALERNPGVAIALLQMAKISFDKGDYPAARDYLRRYTELERHTAESLWLGIRIEQQLGDKNALSSYALLLKNNFPDSREAGLLRESGLK